MYGAPAQKVTWPRTEPGFKHPEGYPIWEAIFKNTELQLSLQHAPSFLEL